MSLWTCTPPFPLTRALVSITAFASFQICRMSAATATPQLPLSGRETVDSTFVRIDSVILAVTSILPVARRSAFEPTIAWAAFVRPMYDPETENVLSFVLFWGPSLSSISFEMDVLYFSFGSKNRLPMLLKMSSIWDLPAK